MAVRKKGGDDGEGPDDDAVGDGSAEMLGPFDGDGPFDLKATPVPGDRKRRHLMTLWPDMEMRVYKPTGMGISSSISRPDFNRLCEIRRLLGKVCFTEITITRKVLHRPQGGLDVLSLLSKMSDEELTGGVVDTLGGLDRRALEAVYLMVHSYTGKDLLV